MMCYCDFVNKENKAMATFITLLWLPIVIVILLYIASQYERDTK
jgi:hypothetical protein